jgi:hypothetical protein
VLLCTSLNAFSIQAAEDSVLLRGSAANQNLEEEGTRLPQPLSRRVQTGTSTTNRDDFLRTYFPNVDFGDSLTDDIDNLTLFRLFYQSWIRDTNFTNYSQGTCPADTNVVAAQQTNGDDAAASECLQPTGEPGAWVCRTLYDPVSGDPNKSSVCADPDLTLASDECGCCNASIDSDGTTDGGAAAVAAAVATSCPLQCTCPCNLQGRGDGTGALIRVLTGRVADIPGFERCMSINKATQLTGSNERYQCVETCSTTQQQQQQSRKRRRRRRTQGGTSVQLPDFNNINFGDFGSGNMGNNIFQPGLSVDDIAGAARNITGAFAGSASVGSGQVSGVNMAAGDVTVGGGGEGFADYFVNKTDGSVGTGVAFNSSSVNITISIDADGDGVQDVITGTDTGDDVNNAIDEIVDEVTDTIGGNDQGASTGEEVDGNIGDTVDEVTDNIGDGNTGDSIEEIIDEVIVGNTGGEDVNESIGDIADEVTGSLADGDLMNGTGDEVNDAIGEIIDEVSDSVGDVGNGDDSIQDIIDEVTNSTDGGEAGSGTTNDIIAGFRNDVLDSLASAATVARLDNDAFDFSVPGFVGDIFNGIDFQEFLNTLPDTTISTPSFDSIATSFGGLLQPNDSGRAGSYLYNLFAESWTAAQLFVDFSTCPAVGSEPVCEFNSDGDTGRWACRTLFHPVTGDPQPFSVCADARRALGTDECGCCGASCPTQCNCPCTVGENGMPGVQVIVGSLATCMTPAMALTLTARNPSFQCVQECTNL